MVTFAVSSSYCDTLLNSKIYTCDGGIHYYCTIMYYYKVSIGLLCNANKFLFEKPIPNT